jgi:bifunctional non-homologous end joining protein LigD
VRQGEGEGKGEGEFTRPPLRMPRETLTPMLCATATALPEGDEWTFQPKYDGIRVLAFASPQGVRLVTRNGNDKARQFPDLVADLQALAAAHGEPLVLDGEIVALAGDEIARFGQLQARMHLKDGNRIRRHAREGSAAFVAFDLLRSGGEQLTGEPWTVRRARLEEVVGAEGGAVQLAETGPDGESLLERGRAEEWEGIIAKRTGSPYRPGRRSADWLKIKLENTQEFVVGGWTEPRRSRQHIGALLLGYYDAEGRLVYAGHTGTGFDRAGLEAMYRRLSRLERKTSPFATRPATNEKAHWTTPRVVVQVRFNEWTRHGTLRQPVFEGVREDKAAHEVVREPPAAAAPAARPSTARSSRRPVAAAGRGGGTRRRGAEVEPHPGAAEVVEQLRALEARKTGSGKLQIPGEGSLPITNLGKVFFPETGHTKGDLMRYYAAMSGLILPAMRDRALVLKRFPNGVRGQSFYQQSAPAEVPECVRVEHLVDEDGEEQPRFIGGNLATLLYTIQLGAISYDPWHSRFDALESADYTIIDLDPGPGATFATVVEVALRVREEMDDLGLHGALKTSGSSGLHVYLPLPGGTPLEAATLVAQIVATRVARKHPGTATVERMTRNRPHGTVYVDYLQNILGKTVAGVYAVRAREEATASAPLVWDELTSVLDAKRFTLETLPARVAELGDLWSVAMAEPNRLDRLTR